MIGGELCYDCSEDLIADGGENLLFVILAESGVDDIQFRDFGVEEDADG